MYIPASMEEAWALLTDIPAIALPPGAKLIDQDGDTYEGTMKVKVDPIVAEYSGTATVVEMNETDRTVKLASGRDKRGAGTHRPTSSPRWSRTTAATVSIATDLKVAGKVANLARCDGRHLQKLLGQFVECIEAKLQQADVVDEAETEPETIEAPNDEAEASAPEPEVSIDDDDDVLDLMGVAGGALAKRLIPAVGGVVAAVIVYLIVRN